MNQHRLSKLGHSRFLQSDLPKSSKCQIKSLPRLEPSALINKTFRFRLRQRMKLIIDWVPNPLHPCGSQKDF